MLISCCLGSTRRRDDASTFLELLFVRDSGIDDRLFLVSFLRALKPLQWREGIDVSPMYGLNPAEYKKKNEQGVLLYHVPTLVAHLKGRKEFRDGRARHEFIRKIEALNAQTLLTHTQCDLFSSWRCVLQVALLKCFPSLHTLHADLSRCLVSVVVAILELFPQYANEKRMVEMFGETILIVMRKIREIGSLIYEPAAQEHLSTRIFDGIFHALSECGKSPQARSYLYAALLDYLQFCSLSNLQSRPVDVEAGTISQLYQEILRRNLRVLRQRGLPFFSMICHDAAKSHAAAHSSIACQTSALASLTEFFSAFPSFFDVDWGALVELVCYFIVEESKFSLDSEEYLSVIVSKDALHRLQRFLSRLVFFIRLSSSEAGAAVLVNNGVLPFLCSLNLNRRGEEVMASNLSVRTRQCFSHTLQLVLNLLLHQPDDKEVVLTATQFLSRHHEAVKSLLEDKSPSSSPRRIHTLTILCGILYELRREEFVMKDLYFFLISSLFVKYFSTAWRGYVFGVMSHQLHSSHIPIPFSPPIPLEETDSSSSLVISNKAHENYAQSVLSLCRVLVRCCATFWSSSDSLEEVSAPFLTAEFTERPSSSSSSPPSISFVISILNFLFSKYLDFSREYKLMTFAGGVHLETTGFLIENLLFILEANVRSYLSSPPSSSPKGLKEAIVTHLKGFLEDFEGKGDIADSQSISLWFSRLHHTIQGQ